MVVQERRNPMNELDAMNRRLEELWQETLHSVTEEGRGLAEMQWLEMAQRIEAATAEVAADMAYDVWVDRETA